MKQDINTIIEGDATDVLATLSSESIDLVLTDPPYFLDKLDNQWNLKKVHNDKNLNSQP